MFVNTMDGRDGIDVRTTCCMEAPRLSNRESAMFLLSCLLSVLRPLFCLPSTASLPGHVPPERETETEPGRGAHVRVEISSLAPLTEVSVLEYILREEREREEIAT